MMPELVVTLTKGRDKAVRQGHPWIFSGALDDVAGDPSAPLARVVAASGEPLGVGFWSPKSQIRVRMLPGADAPSDVDRTWFATRLAEAQTLRRAVVGPDTTGYRVMNAEGDGVPGWTVDRFGDVLVSQVTAAGLEALRGEAYAALSDAFPGLAVLQSNDVPARRTEGLPSRGTEVIAGEPPEASPFVERGLEFVAELAGGQKTGFYCDQRENRALAERLATWEGEGRGEGRTVLDLFAHTGGFARAALRGGARHATLVESAPRLVERGTESFLTQGIPPERVSWVTADVFEELRARHGHEERHGLVVADPPPLVRHRKHTDKGARAYKDLMRLALDRVEPGGLFMTFSCSAAVDHKLFRQILFAASQEAGVRLALLAPLAAAPDHPVAVTHPQGEYLKGWLAQVVGR
jgi:23S rRNA (cytosine1962-C5)-methyltransferase